MSNEQVGSIRDLQLICNLNSKAAQWPKTEPGTRIALIHSEISEALEGIRKDTMDDHLPHRKAVEVELGDAIIRILDFCGEEGLDVGGAIQEKIAYNIKRQNHKPENRAKIGGKKF